MTEQRKILEPGLPHGRLWVALKGCECDECVAALQVEEAKRAAEVRSKVERGPKQAADARNRWRRPRWTKKNGWWVVTEPPGEIFEAGQHVQVYNHTTGEVRKVVLHHCAGDHTVEGDLTLRVWQPVRL